MTKPVSTRAGTARFRNMASSKNELPHAVFDIMRCNDCMQCGIRLSDASILI